MLGTASPAVSPLKDPALKPTLGNIQAGGDGTVAVAAALAMKVLVVGSGAREHALLRGLARSQEKPTLYCYASSHNPGVRDACAGTCGGYSVGDITSPEQVVAYAAEVGATLAVIGPEAPLEAGVADALWDAGVGCVGPKKAHAQLESSKAFTRDLQAKYTLPGSIQIRTFFSLEGVKEYIEGDLKGEYVVKADGLCGGKGVKVSGDHLASTEEALEYCASLLNAPGSKIVIEEKLVGQEFSIISFCDGEHCAHFPPVQDHKRAFHGDLGPNTGGMGSYSCADGLLPFLSAKDVEEARKINEATAAALLQEFGEGYKGILYGQFMSTVNGQKVIEYNARFGDPEALNLISIMESDLLAMCKATVDGSLSQDHAIFRPMATVCKYAVPSGYPDKAMKGCPVDISKVEHPELMYLGAVAEVDSAKPGGGKVLHATGSRTAGVVGVAPTLAEAEAMAEAEVSKIWGAVWHRRDIGTAESIGEKVQHMRAVRGPRIGILGSTRGTNTLHLYEEIAAGRLKAEVAVVISNVADAIILERAAAAGVPAVHIESKGVKRADFDAQANAVLEKHGVDVVLLVGFMRILSPVFCDRWKGKAVNVHPSLLPAHAGLMDLDVHKSVLAAGDSASGCTVHMVDAVVDAGSIVVQPSCDVAAEDTPETLKAKVQALEAPALAEAVRVFGANDFMFSKGGGSGGGLTYKGAGVDIDEGERMVDLIKPIVKETLRPGCGMIGGFGGEFDLKEAGYTDPILVSGTDGVGTKLMLAHKVGGEFANNAVGVDVVAMCVNDIVTMNAEPLFFLDYMATGALKAESAAAVVVGVANGCKQANCGLIGGETAEMPAMYANGTYDVAGFAVGCLERGSQLPDYNAMQPGDQLLAIASAGVHSNGFSLVRKVVEKSGLTLSAPSPFALADGSTAANLGEALLVPTRIYVRQCLAAARSGKVKGISHITGGGLPGNVNRVLPKHLKAVMSCKQWTRPPVFNWIQAVGGVASAEMARTFNCGLGMVFVVPAEEVEAVTALLRDEHGETVFHVGEVAARAEGESQVEVSDYSVWDAEVAKLQFMRPAADEARILAHHDGKLSVTQTELPASATKLYSGKVRDVYQCKDGKTLCLVATDRQSAFDRILAAVPFKGQVLNQVSEWWFRNTTHIVANHLVGAGPSPDPNVVLAQKCTPFPVEFVCRGYMTGSTDTSIWTHYSKKGARVYCGHALPDGMVKNQKLPQALLTPTTKDEHDEPVSAEQVWGELGLMSKADWDFVAEKALALFAFGQKTAAERGLILVDTKYEFGKTESGEIVLIDEVHTPDSSRYWVADSYEARHAAGQEPQNIDKEFLRLWFRARCDPYKDATLPEAPAELVCELSRRYIHLYEKITGESFVFPQHEEGVSVNRRVVRGLEAAGLV